MNSRKLPQFDSISELARFWDTHDLTDFEEELEEVPDMACGRSGPITLHLLPRETKAIHQLASSKGVKDEELIHEWVRQKLSPRKKNGAAKRRR